MFADDNFKFDENGREQSKQVENTVGKGEIARYEQFLLFPQCFQKACFPGASKDVIVWEGVKYSTNVQYTLSTCSEDICRFCHVAVSFLFTCSQVAVNHHGDDDDDNDTPAYSSSNKQAHSYPAFFGHVSSKIS